MAFSISIVSLARPFPKEEESGEVLALSPGSPPPRMHKYFMTSFTTTDERENLRKPCQGASDLNLVIKLQ